MRRIRPQFKPNLGPRGGARSSDMAAKQPVAGAGQWASHSATPSPATQSTADNFTQLKPSEAKSADSVGSAPVVDTVAPAVQADSSAQTLSDKPALGSRSPRKSTHPDQPKSPGILSHRTTEAAVSLSGGTPHPQSHAVRSKSPRKSTSSDPPHSEEAAASVGSTEAETEKLLEKGSTVASDDAGRVRKGAAPPARPAAVRGPRAKFKPNLGAVGRRGHKPAVAEKKTPDPEMTPQSLGRSEEVQGHTTEEIADVTNTSLDNQDVPTTAALLMSSGLASETTSEEVQGSEATATEQPAASVEVPPMDKTDAPREWDTASDRGIDDDGASVSSGATEDLGEMSTDGFAVPHEPRRSAHEKKVRRLKPVLPSSEAVVDRGKMKMSDLIYWNPSRNHMVKKESQAPQVSVSSVSVEEEKTALPPPVLDEESNDDDMMVPQVKLDASGRIILNMDSLVMENKAAQPSNLPMVTIEEDDDRFITCNSFRSTSRQKRWTQSETARFYKALSQVGTDFSLMCSLFPSRSRRELKNKFSKEEKRNGPRIDQALRERQEFDRTTFELAIEEDAAEKRRQEALDEEKKRKKERKIKAEKALLREEEKEEEDTEMEEADIERRIYNEEQEERKENSRKRRNGKLCQDGRKFPAYKRAKAENKSSSSGHAREVVDILINMSQGHTTGDNDDDMSDTASVTSDLDSVTSASPFVPRVARPPHPAPTSRSSSRNVVFDSEVSVPEWPAPDDGGFRQVGTCSGELENIRSPLGYVESDREAMLLPAADAGLHVVEGSLRCGVGYGTAPVSDVNGVTTAISSSGGLQGTVVSNPNEGQAGSVPVLTSGDVDSVSAATSSQSSHLQGSVVSNPDSGLTCAVTTSSLPSSEGGLHGGTVSHSVLDVIPSSTAATNPTGERLQGGIVSNPGLLPNGATVTNLPTTAVGNFDSEVLPNSVTVTNSHTTVVGNFDSSILPAGATITNIYSAADGVGGSTGSGVLPGTNLHTAITGNPGLVPEGPWLLPGAGVGGEGSVDLSAMLEGLQSQSTTPMDVILVEQQLEGQEQGLVHVYLVPRSGSSSGTLASSQGGMENSLQTEEGGVRNGGVVEGGVENSQRGVEMGRMDGGVENSILVEGGVENSILVEGGVENSILVEGGVENSRMEGGVENSILVEGGVENSILVEGGVENSTLVEGGVENSRMEGGVENSILVEGGVENSILVEGGVENSILVEGGVENSILVEGGVENSILVEGGVENSRMEGGVENSILVEGGVENSILVEGGVENIILVEGGVENSQRSVENSRMEGGVENSILAEGGAENSILVEGGVENSILVEGGVENSILAEGGAENSILAEEGAENSILAEGGAENSTLTERGAVNINNGLTAVSQCTEGGEGNSSVDQGNVVNPVLTDGSASDSISQEGGARNSGLSGRDSMSMTPVLDDTGAACSIPQEGGVSNSGTIEGGTGNSILTGENEVMSVSTEGEETGNKVTVELT